MFKGALQLTVAGVITRIIGLLFRMIMSRLVGAEGLGLFQMILPVYALLAVSAGLGLSGAVTKMVADRHARGDRQEQQQILRFSLRLVTISSLVITALLWIALAFPLNFFPDERIIAAIRLLPPAFFFASLSSILRSFSQGRRNMAPTSCSQVGEQVFRVLCGFIAAYWLLPLGLKYALMGLVGGIIAGEIVCFSTLSIMRPKEKCIKSCSRVTKPMRREMVSLALPILLIRLSTSITQTLESLLIPAGLQKAGFSASQATTLFGQLSGMALPLVFLPTVFIIPLNTALVPAIAAAAALHLRERLFQLVRFAIWGTLVLGTVSALILYFSAPSLTGILYGNTSAAQLAVLLAPSAPFAYLQFTTAAILHGMGRPGIAVANDLGGTVAGLTIIYYLTVNPAWGINGVILGYSVSFILIALADCLFISHLMRRV